MLWFRHARVRKLNDVAEMGRQAASSGPFGAACCYRLPNWPATQPVGPRYARLYACRRQTSTDAKPQRMKNCILAIVAYVLVACAAPLALITPESRIEGKSVSGTAIRVNQPFTHRFALYSATFPAGLYVPKFEDVQGIFFKASDQLLGQTIAGGRTMQGGLYVTKESWARYRAYIDEGGELYKFDIAVPIDITVLK